MNHHFKKIHLSSQVDDVKDIFCNMATPILPDIVSHTIDRTSPLYDISPDNIMDTDMELIVSVVVVEPNGSKTTFMTSYLPEEIVWANHFAECIVFKEKESIFLVEVEKMNMMIPNYTPRKSAQNIEENNVQQTDNHKLYLY